MMLRIGFVKKKFKIISKIFPIFFSFLDILHAQKDFLALLGKK